MTPEDGFLENQTAIVLRDEKRDALCLCPLLGDFL